MSKFDRGSLKDQLSALLGTNQDPAPATARAAAGRTGMDRPRPHAPRPQNTPLTVAGQKLQPDPAHAERPKPQRRDAASAARLRAACTPTPANRILQGDAQLNYVRDKLAGIVFAGESPPSTRIPPEVREGILITMLKGRAILQQHPAPDENGFIVGFDFGTSSSKIVIHEIGPGDPAYALPVPEALRVEENGRRQDHLWRTVVWFDPATSCFSILPARNAVAIEGFKTRMLQGDETPLAGLVTAQEAATAYLSMIFAYVLGYNRLHAPVGMNRSSHFSRFHFGVPVSSLSGDPCAPLFRRVCLAAMRLAPKAGEATLAEVRSALAALPDTRPITTETPCILFEELAAVVAGYSASPDRREGPHFIVDIGASTMDIASFNLLGPAGSGRHVPVFYSSVELLGSDSHSVARTLGVSDEQFNSACGAQMLQVISVTSTKRDPKFKPRNDIPKPIILVGGGRHDPLYEEVFSPFEASLQSPRRTPGPGRNLKFARGTDFARLLLAWGLSQEDVNLPRIKPPDEIEDMYPQAAGKAVQYISKDQC